MKRLGTCILILGAGLVQWLPAADQPASIAIDYPQDGSLFPPEFPAPTFLFRDPAEGARRWRVEVAFGDGTPALRVEATGDRMRVGEIDPRCVADTNEPPKLTPQQAASRTWAADAQTWAAIKRHSTGAPATVTITGFGESDAAGPVSRGSVRLRTSPDPVGAPIFYRDVPLMPSELEKGIIKPLAAAAIPLIAWRLRNVGETSSRVLMEGLHTCANCHSFSRDGKTLGMDLDGPRNDKGMYTLASISPRMTIRNQDVITWSSFRGRLVGDTRIGFMSQVSPDGQYVVTTIKGTESEPGKSYASNYYVANFKNYRFLQVFYPTRGILAWYSRATGRLQPLPGADDPRYLQTDGVWSPDGKYLVFARAEGKDPYPEGKKLAEYANDPNETQIQYNLYRIPFNGGKGGTPEPVAGASHNGMSNTFPKVSPDGRWIVFVKCRNGQLMRPDSELYIVPFAGGEARRLRCNTPLMNSWHSFSPNGRWLVFSSKSRSPYTQMFLTHLDEDGNSSPAILIENSTAANRAVNIPEFVNVPPDGLLKIEPAAVEYYRLYDLAWELSEKGKFQEAVDGWKKALALNPSDEKAYTNLGMALFRTGRKTEAAAQYRKALELNPGYAEAHNNLGIALAGAGKYSDAIAHYRKALEINPAAAEVYNDLGLALAATGKPAEAVAQYRKALELNPSSAEVHNNLGIALAGGGKPEEAVAEYSRALELKPDYAEAHNNLGLALAGAGRLDEAIGHFQKVLAVDPNNAEVRDSMALALAGAGRLDEAIAQFQKVLEITPGNAEVHNNLGLALAGAGQPDRAIAHYRKALAINPAFGEAHANLAAALYYLKGRTPEALEHWRAAIRAEPDNVLALAQTAQVLATSPDASLRNGAEAVTLAERAARLSGGREPAVLDALAAAYAETGRFQDAAATARRALAQAVAARQQPMVEALQARIALYDAGTPLRAAPPAASSPARR